MLKIRQEQLEAFAASLQEQFVRTLARDLTGYWAAKSAALGAEALEAFIRRGIATAARYGLTGRADVSRFLFVAFAAGEDFHTEPWAAKVLGDATLAPGTRAARIYTLASMRLRP